jgi:hypothetical protein
MAGGKDGALMARLTLVIVLLALGIRTVQAQEDLRKVVIDLRQAIVNGDAAAVLRHVSRQHGLTCTDTEAPYAQVRRDLTDKRSHLYIQLFDTAAFVKRCGTANYQAAYPPISEKEFFSAAPDAPFEIRQREPGWATVLFRSPVKSHWPREYIFHRESGTWKLTNGPIVSRCTCG